MDERKRAGWPAAAATDYDSRIAALEAARERSERTLAEVYGLMRLVCDELRVDTSPADETVPMLRIIDGGRAG